MKLKIRHLIDSKGLTQSKVAEETKLAPSTVGKLYRGTATRVDLETLDILAEYLGVNAISDLMELDNNGITSKPH